MFLRLFVDIAVLVLALYLCPSSVRTVATFPGTISFTSVGLHYVLI